MLQFCCLGLLIVGDVSAHHRTLYCCSCNSLPRNVCYDMQQLDVHNTLASAAGDSILHSYINRGQQTMPTYSANLSPYTRLCTYLVHLQLCCAYVWTCTLQLASKNCWGPRWFGTLVHSPRMYTAELTCMYVLVYSAIIRYVYIIYTPASYTPCVPVCIISCCI